MGEIFYLGSIFCALLTIYLLIFKENALKSYADYLLSIFFLMQCYCAVLYLLVFSGWIIQVPYLYKTAAPINYLLAPISYLYVRSVLYNEKQIKSIDILHFVPFVFFLINYIPFYILPLLVKRTIVEATIKNFTLSYQLKAGYLPEYLPHIIRVLQAFVYIIMQWKLINNYKNLQQNQPIQKQVKLVLKWLKVFTWSSTVFVIGFFAIIIFALFSFSLFDGFINVLPGIIIAVSFFIISGYLLVHPEVIMGLPFIQYNFVESVLTKDNSDKIPFIREDYQQEIDAIDAYFKQKQPYLINNLSINQVAIILDIPVRELSYIINNYYSMRFTDFVNNHRILHMVENYNLNDLDTFTLESFAKMSGFSSKSSFYRAFNRVYKCTPLEYFLSVKNE
jgi:AraC-like DNA-binding protein